VIEASCHCGAVRLEIARKPRSVTDCNCSICRRYGALWAYYGGRDVRIRARRGSTESYLRGERALRFVRCRHCGCVTHWEAAKGPRSQRMGVNARNLDPAVLARARVHRFDGALTWRRLD
jgi:hypothetical protein